MLTAGYGTILAWYVTLAVWYGSCMVWYASCMVQFVSCMVHIVKTSCMLNKFIFMFSSKFRSWLSYSHLSRPIGIYQYSPPVGASTRGFMGILIDEPNIIYHSINFLIFVLFWYGNVFWYNICKFHHKNLDEKGR
jgi:hypothetical protein